MKQFKRIRKCIIALMMAMVILCGTTLSASAATWTNWTLPAGQEKNFVQSDGSPFEIESNVTISHKATFNRTAPATVKIGFSKNGSVTIKKSGNGTSETISASYTTITSGKYKFYIKNGSSDAITVTRMVVTF